MAHAYDKRLNVGDSYESYWLRITADLQDDEGEPISKPHRCIALEDEEIGSMITLSCEQAEALVLSLQEALRVIK